MKKSIVIVASVMALSLALTACSPAKRLEQAPDPTIIDGKTNDVAEGVSDTVEANPELLFTVFDEDKAADNFRSMNTILPVHEIKSGGGTPLKTADNQQNLANVEYSFEGETRTIGSLFEKTHTNAYMVLKDGNIVDEKYFNGYDSKSPITSWSVAKSFLSALVGIALEEGHIKSVNELVTDYVPALADSGYKGVTIRQVLEMSSGVGFNEDYSDPESDIMQLMPYIVLDSGSVDDFTATLKNETTPDTFYYKSIDTQVIGMILKGATGVPASEYLQEKIWKPAGMSYDAFWNTDLKGNDMSFAFLNARLDDYAKFGLLVQNDGSVDGKEIIPRQWLNTSVTPSRPELEAGKADPYFGYGFQWWVPKGANYGSEFSAIGIYGQFIYVDKETGVVIVKFSSDPAVIVNDAETIEGFRAIAKAL